MSSLPLGPTSPTPTPTLTLTPTLSPAPPQTTQQGLAKRLEWIKSLVLHLVFTSSAATDAAAAEHVKLVLGSVHESITATQARTTDSALLTDLMMMQHVVSSKL